MKYQSKLFVLLMGCVITFSGVSQAQEFGTIRPALKPNTHNVSFGSLPKIQDEDKPAVAPVATEQDEPAVQDKTKIRPGSDFGDSWPAKELKDIRVDIRELNTTIPEDRSSQLIGFSEKQWTEFTPTPKVFAWASPEIRYQPLFFEDVALERYGQTRPPLRQTARSAVHMTKAFFMFPSNMCQDGIYRCDYPLGYCRPGNMIDYTIERQCIKHVNKNK